MLTFIPEVGDFINAALLGTTNQYMIGNVIQSKFLNISTTRRGGAVVHVDGRDPDRDRGLRPAAGDAIAHGGGGGLSARARDRIRTWLLGIWVGRRAAVLFIPILSSSCSRSTTTRACFNFTWNGFTLRHWQHPFSNQIWAPR